MTDGPLCGSAAFTGIVALTDDLFSIGHSFLVLCSGMHTVCHGCAFFGPCVRCSVSPGCENLLHKSESALLLRQRVAPN